MLSTHLWLFFKLWCHLRTYAAQTLSVCSQFPEFFVFVFLIGKFVFSDCFVFGYSVFYFAYLAAVGLTCGMWALGQVSQIFCFGTWTPAVARGSSSVMCGLSSCGCGLSCSMACGILVPQPGIEPSFPALEGKFLTTGPPGK